jgi:hypothetical protein
VATTEAQHQAQQLGRLTLDPAIGRWPIRSTTLQAGQRPARGQRARLARPGRRRVATSRHSTRRSSSGRWRSIERPGAGPPGRRRCRLASGPHGASVAASHGRRRVAIARRSTRRSSSGRWRSIERPGAAHQVDGAAGWPATGTGQRAGQPPHGRRLVATTEAQHQAQQLGRLTLDPAIGRWPIRSTTLQGCQRPARGQRTRLARPGRRRVATSRRSSSGRWRSNRPPGAGHQVDGAAGRITAYATDTAAAVPTTGNAQHTPAAVVGPGNALSRQLSEAFRRSASARQA